MDCEKARGLIVDFLYDELPSESTQELEVHLAECKDCITYKAELQQTLKHLDMVEDIQTPVDLPTLYDAIHKKQHRIRYYLRRQWPVLVTVGACFIMLLAFNLFISEIRYEGNALTITFNGEKGDSLAEKTEQVLANYRENQLVFQEQLTDELRASTAVLLEVIDGYEGQRNRQLAEMFQQIQAQQQQILMATRGEFQNLASETEDRLKQNYLMTLASVADLMDSP